MHRSLLLFLLIGLLLPSEASPQVVNGDFSDGLTGWTIVDTVGTARYVGTCECAGRPPPCCILASECDIREVLRGGILQHFTCGSEGDSAQCRIGFDYRIYYSPCSAYWGTATLSVYVDDLQQRKVAIKGPEDTGWVHEKFFVNPGAHTLHFKGDGNYGWEIEIDNVTATYTGETAVQSVTWSSIKALYDDAPDSH